MHSATATNHHSKARGCRIVISQTVTTATSGSNTAKSPRSVIVLIMRAIYRKASGRREGNIVAMKDVSSNAKHAAAVVSPDQETLDEAIARSPLRNVIAWRARLRRDF